MPPAGSGLVRVTVASPTRSVDLALPGGVRVADLVPELARSVGLLDSATVHGGYGLVTLDGRVLASDSGLVAQGVQDGAVVAVAAGVDDVRPPRYDDTIEAMTDVVALDHAPWDADAGRQVTRWTALLLLLAGAVSLLTQPGSDRAARGAIVVAVALVSGAVALSRVTGDAALSTQVAWAGCAYAAVPGLVAAPDAPAGLTPVAAAGGGVALAGLVAAGGFAGRRTWLLPPALLGTVVLAAALAARASSADPAVVLTATVALVVVAGSGFPRLALGAAGAHVERPVRGVLGIDVVRVRADARLAHEILVAISTTAGLLLVLVAPVAVSLGLAGASVSVLSCLVVMLRSRRHLARAEVVVGLASGVLGMLSVALSTLWLHPAWRPVVVAAVVVTGLVLLAAGVAHPGGSARSARVGDLVEGAALVALLPTLVLASGAVGVLRG